MNYYIARSNYHYQGQVFQISELVELLDQDSRIRKYTIEVNNQTAATILKLQDSLLIVLPEFLMQNPQELWFVINLLSDSLTIPNELVVTFRNEMAAAMHGNIDEFNTFVEDMQIEEDGYNIMINDSSNEIKSIYDNF